MKPTSVVHVIVLAFCLHASNLYAADVFVTSDADSGAGTLREAIGTAVSGDVIVFNIPAASPVITLATQLPDLTADIAFRNDGPDNVFIDRNGTAAWGFSSGTIDPTGLILVDGGVPSADADIIAAAGTTLFGGAALQGNLTTPGTIAPGRSAASGDIGTFTVTGDLVATDATFNLDIDSAGAAQTDLVSVSGTATVTDSTLR